MTDLKQLITEFKSDIADYVGEVNCIKEMHDILETIISQVEKDAIEKTNKRCKRQIEEMLRDMLDDGRPLGDVIKERISDLIEDNT